MDYFGSEGDDELRQVSLNLPAGSNIFGLGGDDRIELSNGGAEGGTGNDTIIGTTPWDSALYWNSPLGVFVDLSKGIAQDGYGTVDTLVNIINVHGSGEGDVFIGNAANNTFWSFSALDLMDGGAGIDKAVIAITDHSISPEFSKTDSGWRISYIDGQQQLRTLETTSVEVLAIYRGPNEWEYWDLVSPTPRLVPDPAVGFQPVPYISTGREQWQIHSWGIESLTFSENAGEWHYPTPEDYAAPANVTPDAQNAALGDFNGDGYLDIVINWVVFPHTIPHTTRPMPTLLWGSPDGLVKAADGTLPDTVSRHMAYRTFAADLNGDGVDDFITGAMATPIWADESQTTLSSVSSVTLAVLGSTAGSLTDVSDLLGTQTLTLGQANSSFDHATAVGDLNLDGRDDVFSGNNLWISTPDEHWQDCTDIVQQMLPNASPMSLAIGDLNHDGANDILALYPNFENDRVILFNDASSTLNFSRYFLPDGLYGANTKDNFCMIADVNYDGLNDIVVAETRALPYYVGSAMQILIQTSPGNFEDETSTRIDNGTRDALGGEGQLFWLDVNGDGYKDIIHSNDGDGVAIFLNDGIGHFELYDSARLNPIRIVQIDGFQNGLIDEAALPSFRAYPADDNHDGIMDWVVQAIKPNVTTDPNEDKQGVLYILDSTGKEFGRDASEVLNGTIYDDHIYGLGGDDRMSGGLGDDILDGGQGNDTAILAKQAAYYQLSQTASGWQIFDKVGHEGKDFFINIERLQFTDVNVALDLSGDGHAAVVAKILGAVFGKESVTNKEYAGIGLYFMDSGMSYQDLAALALNAAGATSNDAIVSLMWKNVVGTDATAADKAPFIAMLEGGMTAGALAQLAGDTEFNTNNIGLVGLASTGLEYLPISV